MVRARAICLLGMLSRTKCYRCVCSYAARVCGCVFVCACLRACVVFPINRYFVFVFFVASTRRPNHRTVAFFFFLIATTEYDKHQVFVRVAAAAVGVVVFVVVVVVYTSWFKLLNDGNYLPHECRIIEFHIFCIILTDMNSSVRG